MTASPNESTTDSAGAGWTEQKHEALANLRELAALATESGAGTLARNLRDDRIPRLEAERLHLVVLGEFNHGKTTLVNALLGAPVLPMGVTPTTALIHRIVYGETPSAHLLAEDGSEGEELGLDGLLRLTVEGGGSEKGAHEVVVRYPASLLERGLVLVDTPGVNDLEDARAEVTYGYVPRSDAVLFLLDAGQILKESERSFLEHRLAKQARGRIFFVVNKLDVLDADEQREALAYARTNLARWIDEPRVWGISAEQALDGAGEVSGLDAFVQELGRWLTQERVPVLLSRARAAGRSALSSLRAGLEVQRAALAMEQEELARRLGIFESDLEASAERVQARERALGQSLAAVKAVVREDMERFAERFAAALPDEIESSQATDLRRYLAGFIEQKLREQVEDEAEEVAHRLERVADEAVAFVTDEARARAERFRGSLGKDAPVLDLAVDTLAYDVGVFAVGAVGVTLMVLSNVLLGGAMTLAAPVLAYVLRGRKDERVKERAKEEAPALVHKATQKVIEAFEVRIDEFGQHLRDFLNQADDETRRSILELVGAARTAQGAGADGRLALQQRIEASLDRVVEFEPKFADAD